MFFLEKQSSILLFLISSLFTLLPGISTSTPTIIQQRLISGVTHKVPSSFFAQGEGSRSPYTRGDEANPNILDSENKVPGKFYFTSNFRRPASYHDQERLDDFKGRLRGFEAEDEKSRRNFWSKDQVKRILILIKISFRSSVEQCFFICVLLASFS